MTRFLIYISVLTLFFISCDDGLQDYSLYDSVEENELLSNPKQVTLSYTDFTSNQENVETKIYNSQHLSFIFKPYFRFKSPKRDSFDCGGFGLCFGIIIVFGETEVVPNKAKTPDLVLHSLSTDFDSENANTIGITSDEDILYLYALNELTQSPAHIESDFDSFIVDFDQNIGAITLKKGVYPKVVMEDGNLLYLIDYYKNE